MIDALMYGVMLMARTENLLSAPPANKSRSPNKLPLLKRFSMTDESTPGTGIWTPSLKTMNMMRVKTARFRNSGTFSTFWMFSNTATHPYCSATGSSPGTTTLPPAASILALADFVKPLATTVSFFSSSPLPRIRTPSRTFLRMPASTRAT